MERQGEEYHLGSSSFITDINSTPTEHLQYLPFGDLFVQQRATSDYYTPYKFTGKEQDEETNYDYFGARYYTPEFFNIWLSIDPMADKYPNISCYAYCNWNPVRLIDPNGMEWEVGENDKSKKDVLSLVSKGNQNSVNIDNGKVSCDTKGMTKDQIEADKGLNLVNNLVKSDKKYLYEVSDVALYKDENSNPSGVILDNPKLHGIINASNGGNDSKDSHTDRPMNGYDGQVTITATGSYYDSNGDDIRSSVVFHELSENYYRTDQKY